MSKSASNLNPRNVFQFDEKQIKFLEILYSKERIHVGRGKYFKETHYHHYIRGNGSSRKIFQRKKNSTFRNIFRRSKHTKKKIHHELKPILILFDIFCIAYRDIHIPLPISNCTAIFKFSIFCFNYASFGFSVVLIILQHFFSIFLFFALSLFSTAGRGSLTFLVSLEIHFEKCNLLNGLLNLNLSLSFCVQLIFGFETKEFNSCKWINIWEFGIIDQMIVIQLLQLNSTQKNWCLFWWTWDCSVFIISWIFPLN